MVKCVITYVYIYSSPDVYMQSLSLSVFLSFFLFVFHSLFTPSFHPHIKAIYHQDQTQCVSQRQADLLVGFFCVCEFYDWGQGSGTQRYISDKVSLCPLAFLALPLAFRAAWPTWIARPRVNATFDLNSWVPGDVTTLTSCCSDSVRCDIVKKKKKIVQLSCWEMLASLKYMALCMKRYKHLNIVQSWTTYLRYPTNLVPGTVLSVWLHRWKRGLLLFISCSAPSLVLPCLSLCLYKRVWL